MTYIHNNLQVKIITVHIGNVGDNHFDVINRCIHEWVSDYGFGLGDICITQESNDDKILNHDDLCVDIETFEWYPYIIFNLIFPYNINIDVSAQDLKTYLKSEININK